MIYFDTAYLAKCYLADHGHRAVRDLAALDSVASCELARVETVAAFHRVLREALITDSMHTVLRRQFEQDDRDRVWTWLPVTSALLKEAARRYEDMAKSVFLRTGDAIHLTCAAEHGFKEIYSSDRHLLAAAPRFGLKARNVIKAS